MIRVPKRPQTAMEVVKTSFHVWKESLRVVLPIALTWAVFNLIFLIIFSSLGLEWQYDENHKFIFPTDHKLLFGWLGIASFVMSIMFNTAIIYAFHQTMQNKIIKFKETLQLACQKALSASMVIFIIMAPVIAMTMFVVGTGWWLGLIAAGILEIYLIFAFPLVIVTDKGIWGSLQESCRLVSSNWWHVAAVIAVMLLMFVIFCLLVVAVELLLQYSIHKERFSIILSGVGTIVWYPLVYAFLLTLLHDLQVRQEERGKHDSFRA